MPKTKTPISNKIDPSLISLKPRQVLLANINMKQSNGKASTPSLKPEQKALLLHSVAAYLNSNGFSKTLKKFLSEAKLEKDDLSDSPLDLEDIFCKHLASCDHGSTNSSRQKVQDLLMDGNSARDKESGKITESKVIEEVIVDDAVTELNKKSKENKKSKKISNSLIQAEHVCADKVKKPVVDNMVCDTEFHESEKKHKEKRKKKSKLDSESLVNNVEPIAVEDKQETKTKEVESLRDSQAIETKMVNANNISLDGETVKSKSKKKKKDGSASQSLSDGDKELDGGKLSITVSKMDNNKISEEDATVKESKHSKKRKRLAAEENNSQAIEKIEVEESKRRKTEGSEEPKGSSQVTEAKTPIGASGHVVNGSDILKSSLHKTTKKQTNGSTEAKTAKEAFQRVKVDEVVFTDERLKDNSYWAKDGADSGYGAKAQEVLGQVRGRDFRHEKTKKKRGSYRGGQIDLQSHSVKFSYSDED